MRERERPFNVPGRGPAEVPRLSWLHKLPRERWMYERSRVEIRGGWGLVVGGCQGVQDQTSQTGDVTWNPVW